LLDLLNQFQDYKSFAVELGAGDGNMLRLIAASNPETLVIGIELNHGQCELARSKGLPDNAVLLEANYDQVIPLLPDLSLDWVLSIFPDPAFIDEEKVDVWVPFYRNVLLKLKTNGTLRVITELTDDLFQPVSDPEFNQWVARMKSIFMSIGYVVNECFEGAPKEYSSRCLDQFRGDPARIRIATFDMAKQ
jgi:hypothetical protein